LFIIQIACWFLWIGLLIESPEYVEIFVSGCVEALTNIEARKVDEGDGYIWLFRVLCVDAITPQYNAR
jgi:hypothetical protein